MKECDRPEWKAIERSRDNPEMWLAEWQLALTQAKLPVSWPAVAGAPPATGPVVCGGCGKRSWWLNGDGAPDAYWMCAVCHPPSSERIVRFVDRDEAAAA